MLLINNEIDLGKSFEKLKESLKEVYNVSASGKPGCHSRALGMLESRVKIHIIQCTDLDMKQIQDYIAEPDKEDNDDLKNVNI